MEIAIIVLSKNIKEARIKNVEINLQIKKDNSK